MRILAVSLILFLTSLSSCACFAGGPLERLSGRLDPQAALHQQTVEALQAALQEDSAHLVVPSTNWEEAAEALESGSGSSSTSRASSSRGQKTNSNTISKIKARIQAKVKVKLEEKAKLEERAEAKNRWEPDYVKAFEPTPEDPTGLLRAIDSRLNMYSFGYFSSLENRSHAELKARYLELQDILVKLQRLSSAAADTETLEAALDLSEIPEDAGDEGWETDSERSDAPNMPKASYIQIELRTFEQSIYPVNRHVLLAQTKKLMRAINKILRKPETLRICNTCQEELTLDFFNPHLGTDYERDCWDENRPYKSQYEVNCANCADEIAEKQKAEAIQQVDEQTTKKRETKVRRKLTPNYVKPFKPTPEDPTGLLAAIYDKLDIYSFGYFSSLRYRSHVELKARSLELENILVLLDFLTKLESLSPANAALDLLEIPEDDGDEGWETDSEEANMPEAVYKPFRKCTFEECLHMVNRHVLVAQTKKLMLAINEVLQQPETLRKCATCQENLTLDYFNLLLGTDYQHDCWNKNRRYESEYEVNCADCAYEIAEKQKAEAAKKFNYGKCKGYRFDYKDCNSYHKKCINCKHSFCNYHMIHHKDVPLEKSPMCVLCHNFKAIFGEYCGGCFLAIRQKTF